MLAAQTRERGRRRAEDPASVIAICFHQRVSQLMSDRVGSRRIFVTNQQQSQRHERRITVIASMANLFIIESAIVLGAGMSQGIVMRMIGLNQNASGQITASGAAGNLSDQLESPFGSAEIRQSQSRIH